MIVGTHFGLFMPALRPGWEKLAEGEPELQVRSRRKIDLENLRAFMTEHGLTLGEPFALPHTDYQWRAYCTRQHWGHVLYLISLDIDYTKFKDTPAKYHKDTKLTDAYGKIWNATLHCFPVGSVYSFPKRGRQNTPPQPDRVIETVYRTENREWRMAGASAQELAHLMREIDSATEGVQLPSEDELNEVGMHIEPFGDEHTSEAFDRALAREEQEENDFYRTAHNDHSQCTHGDSKSAKRRCRQRREGH